ncbi:MAG: hypothetical protein NVS4B7_00880 [Ktedonobacteraceae bacterium]
MKLYGHNLSQSPENMHNSLAQLPESHLRYQEEILRHITEIGSSLRLHMDTAALVKRVSDAACQALRFRYSALYLADGTGYFRAAAASGVDAEEEKYLRQHPLPDAVVAQLITQEYRISDSYFIPGEARIWQNSYITSFFVISDNTAPTSSYADQHIPSDTSWQPEDLMIVPLVSGDKHLLGFLTPDAPLDGLRPTVETAALLELFVNQVAVVIEGARLYEEARQSSEERAALIEIGRVLSAPDSLRDLQTVYQTIYEQVRRVMPADAFLVTRYNHATDKLIMDFLIDEGIVYPPIKYKYFPFRMKQFLFEEKMGCIFSTAMEYATFLNNEHPDVNEDLIGNLHPSQSLLFAPIYYGEELLGLLSAQSYQPHVYTKRHLQMLKEITVQAGIAITNARLNTELRSALKRAQESDRLKDHFLMTASHELRTPLTAIQGYLELLGNFSPVLNDETKNRFLSNAQRACDELVLLLGNVMDTSRIDQERVSLHLESVQVAKAVQLVLEILEPIIAREERPVEVNIAEDLCVWVDDLRLRQIILNLVSNALKYTLPSSKIAITASAMNSSELNTCLSSTSQAVLHSAHQQYAVIAIKDWGPGIASEDQSRLFTKFIRLDSALNSTQRGAGLGLFLCRQLVEAMNGCIWVESQGIADEGTTFALALPLHKDAT